MKSMTGFGRGAFTNEKLNISAELKTVNNRFLDIAMRLPGELQHLDSRIKRMITARLSRGRVEINLTIESSAEISYVLNRPLISGYLAAMKEMQEEFSLSGEPDINIVSRLPNVLQPKKEEPDETFISALETAIGAALDGLEIMRAAEGSALKTELLQILGQIESRLPLIEKESGEIADEYRNRLSKKITDFLAKSDTQIDLDQARLAQEVAYMADRSDISEEIQRLRSHIDQFRAIMDESDGHGKRLDFLTQELNREANTIASKTTNMTVKENALAIKSEIEKIREQVQNIE